jgi:hypothetical protein
MVRFLSFILAILFVCKSTFADYQATDNLTLTLGYSRLNISNKTDTPLNKDGYYFDFDAGFPAPGGVPLLLGAGLSGSAFAEDEVTFFPADEDAYVDFTVNSGIALLDLEARAGLPIPIPGTTHLVVEPRIGTGPFVEDDVITGVPIHNGADFENVYHAGAGVEVHPALEIMSSWDSGALGIDASFIEGWGRFGQYGSRLSEMRLGLFFTLRL